MMLSVACTCGKWWRIKLAKERREMKNVYRTHYIYELSHPHELFRKIQNPKVDSENSEMGWGKK